MFDLITIVTPPLPDDKIDHIVWRNGLQTNSRDGAIYYDNIDTKNLRKQRGIYIQIGTNRRLKAEGSLHKYFNEISGRERSNHDMFTMADAKQAIDSLLHEKGIDPEDAYIYNYEIGLNLNISTDCRAFLDKIRSIGATGIERLIYVNPKYRDERVKTTIFSTSTRKYHKLYDKVFEVVDKKRKVIPKGNILRIETVHRRLGNYPVTNFFTPDNLNRLTEVFFRDWRTLQFEQDIVTPKGTGRAKQQLCLHILDKGPDEVLRISRERHSIGSLSDKEYRNIREFITHEWNDFKRCIIFIQSQEEQEFRELLNTNHVLHRNAQIGKLI